MNYVFTDSNRSHKYFHFTQIVRIFKLHLFVFSQRKRKKFFSYSWSIRILWAYVCLYVCIWMILIKPKLYSNSVSLKRKKYFTSNMKWIFLKEHSFLLCLASLPLFIFTYFKWQIVFLFLFHFSPLMTVERFKQ